MAPFDPTRKSTEAEPGEVALPARMLPVEKLDLIEGSSRRAQEQNEPKAIGQIRVSTEIEAGIGHGRCTNALHKAEARNGPGHDQILQQIEAVLVDGRANSMRGQIPDLRGQLDADVAADLAHPDLLPTDGERSEPQS
jgi:hypothetical protein